MPQPHRDSTARAGDTRPAFNRPPGARAPAVRNDGPTTPKRAPKEKTKQSPAPSPAERPRPSGQTRKTSTPVNLTPTRDRAKYNSGTSVGSSSHLLSAESLSQLNALNAGIAYQERKAEKKAKKKQYKELKGQTSAQSRKKARKNRDVSGAILEEGRGHEHRSRPRPRGGAVSEKQDAWRGKNNGRFSRRFWIIIGIFALLLVVVIAVAVAVSNKKSSSSTVTTTSTSSDSTNSCNTDSIPASAKGTYTDISTWLDTTDFNCTYTNETVGGLSVMGLYTSWDDSTQANVNVPSLDQAWSYGQKPIRGVNLGGWLDLEPFITPSLFNYPSADNVVDEWTLTEKLGSTAAHVLESHYASFVTKQTFVDIRNAGLDHVRIPYPYWAVTTYPGDPYVPHIAWRYLLRAVEWARDCGLRVNLDLHSLPGSQNGWNHSGRQGSVGWLIGPDGALNGQRSLQIHNQLSQFFAQDRYKNVVTIYGLVNEPKMLVIPEQMVLDWNKQAIDIIRTNGISQWIAFGDGFLTLSQWDDMFKGVDNKLLMDTHQYEIFDVPELQLTHQMKIEIVCDVWTKMMSTANSPSSGWGPILNGEYSQADTDCAQYINGVGVGSRWDGTLNSDNASAAVLTPSCPSGQCSCAKANADPSQYSDSYKQFLQMYAEAQMYSFEKAWGWFYWTWETESATQWSWKLGLISVVVRQVQVDSAGR